MLRLEAILPKGDPARANEIASDQVKETDVQNLCIILDQVGILNLLPLKIILKNVDFYYAVHTFQYFIIMF